LLKRLRIALIPVALLVAVSTVNFSGAFSADQDASTGNSAGAGTIDLGGTADGTILLSDAPLRPGAPTREGDTELRHTGTVPGFLFARLSVPADASPALLDALQVQLLKCPDAACTTPQRVVPATGDWAPLSELRNRVELGPVEPGETRRYRVRLRWPAEADDPALYGATGGNDLHLRWSLRT
jgi:hypothetical protein